LKGVRMSVPFSSVLFTRTKDFFFLLFFPLVLSHSLSLYDIVKIYLAGEERATRKEKQKKKNLNQSTGLFFSFALLCFLDASPDANPKSTLFTNEVRCDRRQRVLYYVCKRRGRRSKSREGEKGKKKKKKRNQMGKNPAAAKKKKKKKKKKKIVKFFFLFSKKKKKKKKKS
jgi:hypothetical protein